jgi:predicted CXXCH cytochrome family protein
MKPHRACTLLSAIVLVFAVSFAGAIDAAETEKASAGVPLPVIPRAMGENCVEDTDFMRRNHMDMLKHQRDETMLRGVRTEQHSLRECLNCHVVKGTDSKPVTSASPKHFCRSCHDYAAVSIDCFQCHASRPESGISAISPQLGSAFPTATTVNGSD